MAATSPLSPDANDVFTDMVSIKKRYGNLEGLLLYQKVVDHWRQPGAKKLMFYDTEFKKLLHRHPVNKDRGQAATIDDYKRGVLRFGVQPHCRGCAIAVPRAVSNADGPSDAQPYFLVGHATLTEAVYAAHEEEPENPQVIASLSQGLPEPLVLSPRTPRDVLLWIKEEHNRWHRGAGQTIIEYMEKALDAQSGWHAELKRMQKTSRDFPASGKDGYHNTMLEFILSHYNCFQKWAHFQHTVAFVNDMKKRNLYDKLKGCLGQGEFLNIKVDNALVSGNYHKLLGAFTSPDFVAVHEDAHLDQFLLEALNMCHPLRHDPDLYILKESIGNKLDAFKVPMSGSIVHKSLQRKGQVRSNTKLGDTLADENMEDVAARYESNQKAVAALQQADNTEEGCKGNKNKRKAEEGAQKAETPQQKQQRIKVEKVELKKLQKEGRNLQKVQAKDADKELVCESMGSGTSKRGKVWFDDAIACVFGPLVKIQPSKRDDKSVKSIIKVVLRFFFHAEVTFGGTMYKQWSKLRKAIRTELLRVHQHVVSGLPGIPDPRQASTAAIADALCELLGEDPADGEGFQVEATPEELTVQSVLEDDECIEELVVFLKDIVLA